MDTRIRKVLANHGVELSESPIIESSELSYPLDVEGYVSTWGETEIDREFRSNWKDSGAPERIIIADNTIAFIDNGKGIKPAHWLIGKSVKLSKDAIGMFGEGMKIASLTALRLGMRVLIVSGEYIYTPHKSSMFDSEIMIVTFEKYESALYHGTIAIIDGWGGKDYSDRYTDNKAPLYHTSYGDILKNEGRLYNKSVQFMDNTTFSWDYGFSAACNIEMNRDRSNGSMGDVMEAISNIWCKVTDITLWQQFINNAKNLAGESNLPLYYGYLENDARVAMESAWHILNPGKCALVTDDSQYSEMKHRRITPIWGGEYGKFTSRVLSGFIPTARDILDEFKKKDIVTITSHDKEHQKTLGILRKVIRRYNDISTQSFDPKNLKIGIIKDTHNALGLADYATGRIILDITVMDNIQTATHVFIHELGHMLGGEYAKDLTDTHVNAITKIGAALVLSYTKHDI